MAKCKAYQGHKNRNHWSVNLWLYGDEGLYREAMRLCSKYNRAEAAEKMLEWLHGNDIYETPDGAKYSVSSIRAAMVGIN
jgi:hypothetical protein